ncbi:patatin [Peribacillus saganii]|uniref:Patatin n=1 Tax=Peribacillus saganii TaxID=2303992 RepID=A0A372LQX0_9BACI|nr:CBASS cGAMP-activated phospholipase [Peribacillus saganii]RFU70619.1 patatin [Peribacillus saganii]
MRKILSIDGGGIKGVFPASFLASIEDAIEENIGDYFDLIIGTSTGGIIALGLASGMSAKDVLAFYENDGPAIFKGNRILKGLQWFSSAKYSEEPLDKALKNCFGEKKIGECSTRVVVPSMNLDTGEVHVYKTAHHVRFKNDYKKSIVEAARATSAAPTFFPSMIAESGTALIDGGMWANNPVGTAVVEAIGVLGWQPGEFKVLSIGCTKEPFSADGARKSAKGAGYWAPKLADAFMSGQTSQSLGTAQLLAGHENVYRYGDNVMPKDRYKLDGIKEIKSLKGLGETEARKVLHQIEDVFFKEKAESFVPFHQLIKEVEAG